jgi:hypothetical protein
MGAPEAGQCHTTPTTNFVRKRRFTTLPTRRLVGRVVERPVQMQWSLGPSPVRGCVGGTSFSDKIRSGGSVALPRGRAFVAQREELQSTGMGAPEAGQCHRNYSTVPRSVSDPKRQAEVQRGGAGGSEIFGFGA